MPTVLTLFFPDVSQRPQLLTNDMNSFGLDAGDQGLRAFSDFTGYCLPPDKFSQSWLAWLRIVSAPQTACLAR